MCIGCSLWVASTWRGPAFLDSNRPGRMARSGERMRDEEKGQQGDLKAREGEIFIVLLPFWPTFLLPFPALLGMDIWFSFCFACNIMKDMEKFVHFFEERPGSGSHSYPTRVNRLSQYPPNKCRILFNYVFKTTLAKTWRMQYRTAGHLWELF